MKKHLLFLGAPGAGKGTQAELLLTPFYWRIIKKRNRNEYSPRYSGKGYYESRGTC